MSIKDAAREVFDTCRAAVIPDYLHELLGECLVKIEREILK